MPHTPGPWFVHYTKATKKVSGLISVTNNEEAICETLGQESHPLDFDRSTAEQLANAHLIAAAPDLLKDLEATVELIEGTGDDRQWVLDLLAKAKATIAKATGQ